MTSQSVSGLSAGTTYTLTFLMASESSKFDQLRVSVDGSTGSVFNAPAYGGNFWDTWVSQSFSFVASSSSETIQFDTIGLNQGCCDVGLDKVSLLAASGAVPEPATWAMMLMGFGMAGFGLRRRRKPTVSVNYA